jgi:phage gpG-like protein
VWSGSNSAATLGLLTSRLSGQKSKVKKDGSLNASGQRALANKKPLIAAGDLRRQFTLNVTNGTLTVSNTQQYAAIQQFGGKAGRGHKVTIPARPFLPIHPNGTLYPAEQSEVLQALNAYLMQGL